MLVRLALNFFVLISRGRHLSTRNPGPPSPVETGHPLTFILYHGTVPKIGFPNCIDKILMSTGP